MGAAAYNRGSRALAAQIARDYGRTQPDDFPRRPRNARPERGTLAMTRAIAKARSILASNRKAGIVMDVERLAGSTAMCVRSSQKTALLAAATVLAETHA